MRHKDTNIEMKFRKALCGAGMKGYRLNYKLHGTPDVVFVRKRIAIFIDGCFWHKCPKHFGLPKTNKRYWSGKIEENVRRDRRIDKTLKSEGWRVIRIWEHEIKKNPERCVERIMRRM